MATSPGVSQGCKDRVKIASVASARKALYKKGFEQGYPLGVQMGIGQYAVPFDGTSIIIPTYNQLSLVQQCVETIKWNTPEPHEIIIVDNASTDGTARYLRSHGSELRYRVMDRNYGFSGAINMGLMMAKGKNIVLLNNDTLVTANWLSNMLRCLYSDENIGMVGPITNYISGSQLIKVPYGSLRDMPEFARRNNRPDSSRWRETDLLIGFCLLFRRQLFEDIGYFDEGFQIGNYEDNDYSARVRLLGKKLMVAEDSFIHHIGSVSIKAVGEKMTEFNGHNEHYFTRKWPNLSELAAVSMQHSSSPLNAASYYPERVIVRGIGAAYYWIDKGQRRPVNGVVIVPVTKVSQVDLRRWPVGEPIAAEEAERRWHGYAQDGEISGYTGTIQLADGTLGYIEGDTLRIIAGEAALQGWSLDAKPRIQFTPERVASLNRGLPIVAPTILKQSL